MRQRYNNIILFYGRVGIIYLIGNFIYTHFIFSYLYTPTEIWFSKKSRCSHSRCRYLLYYHNIYVIILLCRLIGFDKYNIISVKPIFNRIRYHKKRKNCVILWWMINLRGIFFIGVDWYSLSCDLSLSPINIYVTGEVRKKDNNLQLINILRDHKNVV